MKTLWSPLPAVPSDTRWHDLFATAWVAHDVTPTSFVAPPRAMSPLKRLQRAIARRWLKAVRQREWRRKLARAERRARAQQLARAEACADEGAWLEFSQVILDGQTFGALYRDGELVCLLPQTQRL